MAMAPSTILELLGSSLPAATNASRRRARRGWPWPPPPAPAARTAKSPSLRCTRRAPWSAGRQAAAESVQRRPVEAGRRFSRSNSGSRQISAAAAPAPRFSSGLGELRQPALVQLAEARDVAVRAAARAPAPRPARTSDGSAAQARLSSSSELRRRRWPPCPSAAGQAQRVRRRASFTRSASAARSSARRSRSAARMRSSVFSAIEVGRRPARARPRSTARRGWARSAGPGRAARA